MRCFSPVFDIEIHSFPFQPIDSRMYIVLNADGERHAAFMIDPCISLDAMELLQTRQISDITILLTHEHYDHISGVNYYRERFACNVIVCGECAAAIPNPRKNLSCYFEALFCTHPEEIRERLKSLHVQPYSCKADVAFEDLYTFGFGHHRLEARHTPGHSGGSVCILLDGVCLFSGDSLLRVPAVTRLPGGSKCDYRERTLPYLKGLGQNVIVYPGHGDEGPIATMIMDGAKSDAS